jgi:hypothetical protein
MTKAKMIQGIVLFVGISALAVGAVFAPYISWRLK